MSLLDTVYKELDYKGGALYGATDSPLKCPKRAEWLEKGEWLNLAHKVGAEKVFFVENNPVIVFSECLDDIPSKMKAFNRAWCMARPRLLFLATPGNLTVYDLAQPPVRVEDDWKKVETLEILDSINQVSTVLRKFHRENIESGKLFGDKRFGGINNRADKALISDLKAVRNKLVSEGLGGPNVKYAHALIGRSIFIRYLEDRGILTEEYLKRVAKKKDGWMKILQMPIQTTGVDLTDKEIYYPRILSDKDFAYALFKQLSSDFNGDMFPDIDEEQKVVKLKHLEILKDMLYGNTGIQQNLFLYAYQFDIIPLDLISSIYEEFYHNEKADQDGAFYTPLTLVEFILSRVLDSEAIKKDPRVLDPACGSGIFLVEAFRRIVRYRTHAKRSTLSFDELKTILKDQIAGIEVNPEAARVAAFSLYLSMLHYLNPPAIHKQIQMGNKLPNLVATEKVSENYLHCILPVNAFDVEKINSLPHWKKRFGDNCADIIVGNPPWGAPKRNADQDVKDRHEVLVKWCEKNSKPIGDIEASQAFVWRVLDFLKDNSKAGMLVSAGLFFKHGTKSKKFRKDWLNCVKLKEVYNFIHTRNLFFEKGISPFVSIVFEKAEQKNQAVYYWSAKQTTTLEKTQAVLFTQSDLQILRDVDLSDSHIWKIFWWGRYDDNNLMNYLKANDKLSNYVGKGKIGRGFEIVSCIREAPELKDVKWLPSTMFSRYGKLSGFKESPSRVYRLGFSSIYSGNRVLVQKGIIEKCSPKGQLVARYETTPYCFTNSIIGFKLNNPEKWRYQVIIGILWSSLSRYFFFLKSSKWGLWHHELHIEDDILQLPVVLSEDHEETKNVIKAVEDLQKYDPVTRNIENPTGIAQIEIDNKRKALEFELDKAVFGLFNLDEAQIDLIRDLCEVTLPFFYHPFDSVGAKQAIRNKDRDISWIKNYIKIFGKRWNTLLSDDEEIRAEIHLSDSGNMVAVEFFPADKSDSWNLSPKTDTWSHILDEIQKNRQIPMGSSQIILEGVVHVVSDNAIIIAKRNEKRLWTKSMAREDSESTMSKRLFDTMPKDWRE